MLPWLHSLPNLLSFACYLLLIAALGEVVEDGGDSCESNKCHTATQACAELDVHSISPYDCHIMESHLARCCALYCF